MGEPQIENKSIDLTFGSSVGAGIQELFITDSIDKAKLKAFLSWDIDLLYGIPLTKSKKCFPTVIHAIEEFLPHFNIIQSEWELFYFDDSSGNQIPAIELSATVRLPNGFRYRIFIDVVLRHKVTGELLVLELKTTGSNNVNEAQYGNSNQALSYSVILDKISPGNSSYYVWYFVYCSSMERWEPFNFIKTRLDKANWIRTVLYDTRNIETCIQDGFFPKQGENCFDYGRPCIYYGSCDMSRTALYAGDGVIKERIDEENKKKYNYEFTIEDLVSQQLEEINA